jgi:cytosine/adenosine deaminase-related metal-dependent hydrolase
LALAVHLAESRAELELLEHRRGAFVDFLKEMEVWDPAGLIAGPEDLMRYYADIRNVLFIHANYLDPQAPFPRGATVIYCPRTHAAFRHDTHPVSALLNAGIPVALGTDGLSSNPDLDVLAEARFVRQRHPDVPAETVLRMATLAGAEALGWQSLTGSLTPGKSADLVVLPLASSPGASPYERLLDSSLAVQASMFQGRWVFGSPASDMM